MRTTPLALTVALSIFLGAGPLHAAPGECLGWLPGETTVAFRVDFKDLWRGPLMGDSRKLIQKGGAAYALLQLQMSPRLDEIEEIAGGAWLEPDGSPAFLVAMSSSEPIEGYKAALTYLGPAFRAVAGAPVPTWESAVMMMAQPAGKEILLGTPQAVKSAASRKKGQPRTEGLLEGQFALRLNQNPMIDALAASVPEPFKPLAAAKSARMVIGTSNLKAEAKLVLEFGSEIEADKALEATNAARKMAKPFFDQGRAQIRKELGVLAKSDIVQHFGLVMGLGQLNLMEKELDAIKVNKKGAEISTSVQTDVADLNSFGVGPVQLGVALGLLLPAVQKTREAANRMSSMNNLKQLGIAMHAYHDTNGHFPPAVVTDKNGKPLYSWRVLILPYIEQEAVYRAWKLDEPWDSPNNRRLSDTVIKIFCEPTEPPTNRTHYRVFHGNGAIFKTGQVGIRDAGGGSRIADILDGTSNTLMIAQTRDSVPWAAPDEIAYDPKKPLPALGLLGSDRFLTAFADGVVLALKSTIKPQTLHMLIQKNDGMILPENLER